GVSVAEPAPGGSATDTPRRAGRRSRRTMSTITRSTGASASDGLAARLARLSPQSKALIFTGEVLVFLAIWQLVVGQWKLINAVFLPPPLKVLEGLQALVVQGIVQPHAALSVQSWF